MEVNGAHAAAGSARHGRDLLPHVGLSACESKVKRAGHLARAIPGRGDRRVAVRVEHNPPAARERASAAIPTDAQSDGSAVEGKGEYGGVKKIYMVSEKMQD